VPIAGSALAVAQLRPIAMMRSNRGVNGESRGSRRRDASRGAGARRRSPSLAVALVLDVSGCAAIRGSEREGHSRQAAGAGSASRQRQQERQQAGSRQAAGAGSRQAAGAGSRQAAGAPAGSASRQQAAGTKKRPTVEVGRF